jgi:2-oxoisovalerate dehydrogenase E2 component (dihydrolipoyl transacylase)
VVVPPCVCIVGAGRLHHAVVPVHGWVGDPQASCRSRSPSITAPATGGEAARFLKAMLDDLARAN